MYRAIILFFISVFFIFPLNNAFCQITDSNNTKIIGIEILGLKRTKLSTAEEPLRQFLGMNAETINLDLVRAAILGLGILDPLEVKIENAKNESGKILWMRVQEKWSVFPIPVFFINSDGFSGGLMFMDSNAFGLNDKFIAGGIYGTSGWMAALMYFHQGRKGVPGWNAAFMYSSGVKDYQNQKEKSIRNFQLDSLSAMMGLSYSFNQIFSGNVNVSLSNEDIRRTSDSFAVPEHDGFYLNPRIGFRLSQSDWDAYFLSEKSLSSSFEYSYGFDGPSYYTLSIDGNLEHSLFPVLLPGLKGWLRAALHYSPDAPPLFESGSSSVKIDILPSSFLAKNYIGGSVGLEKSLFRFSIGTLSALASYQLVFSEGPLLDQNIDHGIAGGVRMYLRKLAIPALGFGVSYNFAASYFQMNFSLGMSF
jgi:hypothetical protein